MFLCAQEWVHHLVTSSLKKLYPKKKKKKGISQAQQILVTL